eukprot:gene7588-9329_t
MGVQTLNDQEKGKVKFLHGNSCDVLSTAVARLYEGKQGRWEFAGIVGAVSVINNRVEKTHYIRIVELTGYRIVFEQEFYDGFDYQKQREFFHTFEGDSTVFGLSFGDANEAIEFYTHVLNITSKSGSAPVNATASRATNTSSTNLATSSSTSTKKEEKKKKGGGLFGKFFGNEEKEELEISSPTNFKHESHIGWDAEHGFEIRNIPPDWRKLFQSAGIKKSELKNAETAQFIVNIIGDQLVNAQMAQQNAPPAPSRASVAPITPSRSAPPPPPPSGGAPPSVSRPPPPPTGGAPPPPPPPPPSGGGPPRPPPPPSAGGPPPPPPSGGAGFGSGGGGGGSGGGRSDLLASIREGKELKSVTERSVSALPDINQLGDAGSRSLVDTLAAAMAHRRGNLREDEHDDEDDDDDDDWSD